MADISFLVFEDSRGYYRLEGEDPDNQVRIDMTKAEADAWIDAHSRQVREGPGPSWDPEILELEREIREGELMANDEHTLVASSNSGRYALDSEDGPDITSGLALAIKLGDQWISGRVEYAHEMYVNMGMQSLGEPPRLPRVIDGYYFISHERGVCGLCVGMIVKPL